MNTSKIKEFVDIDGAWTGKGVIVHSGDLVVFVRTNLSSSAPTLKELRYPGHLLRLVRELSPSERFNGQPAQSQALALFQAAGPGGGLLIASFGKLSAFDRSVESERHTGVTVY